MTGAQMSIRQVLGGPRYRYALVILGLVLLAIAAGLPGLRQPIDRDLATYATIGARMQSGDLPYRDLFDHKQPLVYVVYWLLATIAPASTVAIRLTAVLLHAFSGVLVYVFLTEEIGAPRAALAGALVIICGASRFVEGVDLNTEHLLVPLSIAAVLWPWSQRRSESRWFPYLSGILGGLAILAKAIGVCVVPAALFVLFLGRNRRGQGVVRTAIAYFLGLASPILAVVLFYALKGALPELISANLSYNLQYMRWAGGGSILGGSLLRLAGPIDALCLAGMLVAVHVLVTDQGKNLLAWTVLIWMIGSRMGASAGGRVFPHYLAPLVPPAVILLCLPIHWRLIPKRIGSLGLAIVIVAIAAPFIRDAVDTYGYSPDELAVLLYGSEARAWLQQDGAGRWLRNQANASDSLFVSGAEPGFYWSSGLKPATRYLYDYPRLIEPGFDARVDQALTENPPKFVVLPGATRPPYLTGLANLPYEEVARFGDVRILELLSSQAGSEQPPEGLTPAKSYDDHINESLTFYNAGDYQKSIEAAQSALQLQPNSAIAYNNICAAYNQLKLWDQAIEACGKALAINPDYELAKNNLAVAQQGSK